jgi:hypothetical protein
MHRGVASRERLHTQLISTRFSHRIPLSSRVLGCRGATCQVLWPASWGPEQNQKLTCSHPQTSLLISANIATLSELHPWSWNVVYLQLRLKKKGKASGLRVKEFSQRNQTWELRTSNFAARRSWISLSQNVDCYSQMLLLLRVHLNLDGDPITSNSHTHPSHSQTSRLLTSSLSLGVPVPRPTQCMRDT